MNTAHSRNGLHLLPPQQLEADFPILSRKVNGRRLAYLDSGASTQRPRAVIDAVVHYETQLHSNVHRGVHTLSQLATDAFEGARERARRFINAKSTREIIFVRGTTEAINLVAQSWGRGRSGNGHVGQDDEIIVSALEHHANLVPWQQACLRTGATLRWIGLTDDGRLDLSSLDELFTDRTKVLAFAHASNVLGTVTPVAELVARAR